jgi:hypothetical protein
LTKRLNREAYDPIAVAKADLRREVPSITGHPFISPYEDLKLKGASP